jgi:hypothetical protein
VEVTGYAVNLEPVLPSFGTNGLTVDYSSADISGLPGGLPAEGLFVEVQGTLDAIGEEMVASKIQPGDELDAVDAAEIKVTGFVTDFFRPPGSRLEISRFKSVKTPCLLMERRPMSPSAYKARGGGHAY